MQRDNLLRQAKEEADAQAADGVPRKGEVEVVFPEYCHPDGDAALVPEDEQPYYPDLLRQTLAAAPRHGRDESIVNVHIDVRHLFCFQRTGRGFVEQLRKFPTEVIPLMDIVLNDVVAVLRQQEDAAAAGDHKVSATSASHLQRNVPRVRARV